MLNLELSQQLIVNILAQKQIEDIVVFNQGINNLASCVIIGSGRSSRNIAAIADHLSSEIKKQLINAQLVKQVKVEGAGSSEWVLLNLGEIIVHLFTPATRVHYNLEELYSKQA